jgi:hypothetical protein
MGEKIVLFKSLVGCWPWLVLLPRRVNNLIWGFVGFQSKTAKEIE